MLKAVNLIGIILILSVLGPPSLAQSPTPVFQLPLDCQPGKTCWISNYVDHDPGEGVRDYQCGMATYNVRSKSGKHHQGTDFAIRDLKAMQKGVAVLAAAPGVVIGARDGMKDISSREIDVKSLKGKLCGNGVRIKHAAELTTQYCHLRQGSIAVKPGDRVKAGQRLGLIGLSGFTQYPHLHITVRHGEKLVDPFVGVKRKKECGPGEQSLWHPTVLKQFPYGPSAIYTAGFADEKANPKKIRAGLYPQEFLSRSAKALVLWVDMFQVRAGDKLELIIIGPDRKPMMKNQRVIKKKRARHYAFAGKPLKKLAWPTGTYVGVIRLLRSGTGPGQKSYQAYRTITVR